MSHYTDVLIIQWGPLTHSDRVTHICVSKLTIIGSVNGLSPGRRQAIIWTNAGIVLIGPLRINFNETSIEIHTFSFKKIHLKLSSGKMATILSRPQCVIPAKITRYCIPPRRTTLTIVESCSHYFTIWSMEYVSKFDVSSRVITYQHFTCSRFHVFVLTQS